MKNIISTAIVSILVSSIAYPQAGNRLRERLQQRRNSISTQKATADNSAPDYSNLYYWAAHPAKHDLADSVPASLKNEMRDTSADVFFLHPTSFTNDIANAAWNADLHDEALNTATDMGTILNQASVFNASCRIFAPRYRQAHLKAFFMQGNANAQAAFDMAYSDLKAAFEYYLEHYNHGRPIIIASHSQGSYHAIRLLKEFFDGKPLQKQLVCAYVVGYQIKKDAFTSIPLGTQPNVTGCVVGWRTYKFGTVDRLIERENSNSLCINPVTWTTTADAAPKEQHKGMLARNFMILPKIISAKIDTATNTLWAQLPDKADDALQRINNYHIADYNLFYMDIRENVRQRIQAFLRK